MPTTPIYLDHHATTPVDPAVVETMTPYFGEIFANPASPHGPGLAAAQAVEVAREEVAALLGVKRREIVFTSGATEATNLALRLAADGRRRIVSVASEHPSVIEPLQALRGRGYDVELIGLTDGAPDLDQMAAAVNEQTLLVSVSAANHEIGTIVDLEAVAQIAHRVGAVLHSDVAQAAGKIPLRLGHVDLASVSAHKLYGPKGVGALYVSDDLRGRLAPLQLGGGQEQGLRSGTLNVPGIVGFGAAATLAASLLDAEAQRLAALRDDLCRHLLELDGVSINGPMTRRLPGSLNVRIAGVPAEALIAHVPEVAFAAGSACSSLTPAPSPVLMAMGLSETDAEESIRLCVGRHTSGTDIQRAADLLIEGARCLRQASAVGVAA